MGDVWYYQYKVVLWDSDKCEEEIVTGIVPGTSFSDVVQKLESFYGNEILNITTLKLVYEGEVFEFEYANEDATDFDYVITEKE
jgi:hypothetical protein